MSNSRSSLWKVTGSIPVLSSTFFLADFHHSSINIVIILQFPSSDSLAHSTEGICVVREMPLAMYDCAEGKLIVPNVAVK